MDQNSKGTLICKAESETHLINAQEFYLLNTNTNYPNKQTNKHTLTHTYKGELRWMNEAIRETRE